jgi:hypothetical protein
LYLYFICVEIQNENKVMMGEKGIWMFYPFSLVIIFTYFYMSILSYCLIWFHVGIYLTSLMSNMFLICNTNQVLIVLRLLFRKQKLRICRTYHLEKTYLFRAKTSKYEIIKSKYLTFSSYSLQQNRWILKLQANQHRV